MKIAIRVDASPTAGLGHVARMRNLATELRTRGADVAFLCEEPSPAVRAILGGYRVIPLPVVASETEDAKNCLSALDGADVVVLDHYGLGRDWERTMRAGARVIAVMEDIATRPHEVDILIDQNYSLSFAEKYKGLVPDTTRTYFGPRYALLAPEYRQAPPEHDGGRRILISFGGLDADDITGKVFAALSGAIFAYAQIDIVVGASYPHRMGLEAAIAQRPGSTLHVQLPTLAPLLDTADIAIGAAGVSAWERFAKGVPTILVTLADNQYPASRDLHTSGVAIHAGRFEALDITRLKNTVRGLLDDPDRRAEMSRRGRELVDGHGAQRVADALYAFVVSG